MDKSKIGVVDHKYKTPFGKFLNQKSEFFFIYPGVPAVLMFFSAIITSAVIHDDRDDYDDCKSDFDLLWGFLLGQIVLFYIFLLSYANLVLEMIRFISDLRFYLVFFIIYCFLNTAWTVIGIYYVLDSDCDFDDTYYTLMAWINIGLFSLFLLIMIIAGLVVLCKKSPAAVSQGEDI
jgi:hypothetical protein